MNELKRLIYRAKDLILSGSPQGAEVVLDHALTEIDRSAPVITRQAIIDILVSSGNLSEGVTADLIIIAIGAQQSQRVTEQDAREMAYSALCSVGYDADVYIVEWMMSKCPLLLDKLNGDRDEN